MKFGKNADLSKITYYCSKCQQNTSNNKSSNKKLPVVYSDAVYNSGGSGYNGSKEEDQPIQRRKASSGDHLDCIALIGPRYFWKPKEVNFPYVYSENYQTVEKLVSGLGKNIGLSEEEFYNDFLTIYEEVGDQEMISEQMEAIKILESQNTKNHSAFGEVTGFRTNRLNNKTRLYNKKC